MSKVFENKVVRPVRIFTEHLILDGLLNISLGGRTLDELNLEARTFLTLVTPRLVGGSWEMTDAPVAVNKGTVLFVLEVPDLGATIGRTDEDPELRRFGRAALRLRVGGYTVEGYVHTGPGGSSLMRFNQTAHRFIALQSVVVTGSGPEFSAQFLAVNRTLVLSAQEMFSVNPVPEPVGAGAGGDDS